MAPPGVERVPAVDMLRRRSLSFEGSSDICVLCESAEDSVNHLFIHCQVASSIWSLMLYQCGIASCASRLLTELAESLRGAPFSGCGLILWRIFPFSHIWSIWKEKNNMIFRGVSFLVLDLTSVVFISVAKWASI